MERTLRLMKRKKPYFLGLVLILPLFLYHFFIVIVPSFETLIYALYDWNGITEGTFVGLKNFKELLTDSVMKKALINNLIWTALYVVVPIIVAILIAILVSGVRNSRLQMLYRTLIFLPYVVSASISGKIWSTFFNPYYGLGKIFESIGFDKLASILWLGDTNIALYTVCFVNIWGQWPFVMVLIISALQQIDPELYEAGVMDGCGHWKAFWNITLPGIAPTFVFVVMISLMWSMTSYDYVWVMTQGGPAHATELLSTYIYKNAFELYRAGYANAICIIQSLIILIIFIINNRISKKVEDK